VDTGKVDYLFIESLDAKEELLPKGYTTFFIGRTPKKAGFDDQQRAKKHGESARQIK